MFVFFICILISQLISCIIWERVLISATVIQFLSIPSFNIIVMCKIVFLSKYRFIMIKCFREKAPPVPAPIETTVMPTAIPSATIDAAKRRQLPAWIREGILIHNTDNLTWSSNRSSETLNMYCTHHNKNFFVWGVKQKVLTRALTTRPTNYIMYNLCLTNLELNDKFVLFNVYVVTLSFYKSVNVIC